MNSVAVRRAALLGVAAVVSGCDLITLATNPAPSFEQTWNLPAASQTISVADLLPPSNVTILPDSSAFALTMDSTSISAVLGPNCAACVLKSGTSDIKPGFTMAPGNSTSLPPDITGAAISAGQIVIKLTNNLTFDPLYVNTTPGAPVQGHLVIIVRSASIVLGRDSIRGAAAVSGVNMPFAPGTTITRTINLTTGDISGNIAVDVQVDSPQGDHAVPIDANRTFNASASVPSIHVASVQMNVPNRTMDSGTNEELPLGEMSSDAIVEGRLIMDITNPFVGVTGNLGVLFKYGPAATDTVHRVISLPSGATQQRVVVLDSAAMQKILVDGVILQVTGTVNSASPVTVTPTQAVAISNRFVLKIRTPTGDK